MSDRQVLLTEATTDQLAEAIAAGIHVGLRRLMADVEAFASLRQTVETVDIPDLPPQHR